MAGPGLGAEMGRPRPGAACRVFAHLPMLVNEQRKKLSKRKDPVAVESYRDQGYLPEAFRNYLALLGWSPPGDQEKVGLDVLVGEFRLEDVHHAPAFFDVKKLTQMNGEYIRELSVAEFVAAAVRGWLPCPVDGPRRRSGRRPGRPSASTRRSSRRWPRWCRSGWPLGEVPGMVDFVFLAEPVIDEASWEKAVAARRGCARDPGRRRRRLRDCDWTAEAMHEVTMVVAEEAGRKLGKAQAPIRVAVTGRTVGPPLFESLEVLGRDEVLRRLDGGVGDGSGRRPGQAAPGR